MVNIGRIVQNGWPIQEILENRYLIVLIDYQTKLHSIIIIRLETNVMEYPIRIRVIIVKVWSRNGRKKTPRIFPK